MSLIPSDPVPPPDPRDPRDPPRAPAAPPVVLPEFVQAVEAEAEAARSYWKVEPTDGGLRLVPDRDDPQWREVYAAHGSDADVWHDVRWRPEGTFSITDHWRERGGVRSGHLIRSYEHTVQYRRQGWRFVKVGESTFRSGEGRRIVEAAGNRLGLRQVTGTTERIAIGAAAIGGGIAVLTALMLVVGAVLSSR